MSVFVVQQWLLRFALLISMEKGVRILASDTKISLPKLRVGGREGGGGQERAPASLFYTLRIIASPPPFPPPLCLKHRRTRRGFFSVDSVFPVRMRVCHHHHHFQGFLFGYESVGIIGKRKRAVIQTIERTFSERPFFNLREKKAWPILRTSRY